MRQPAGSALAATLLGGEAAAAGTVDHGQATRSGMVHAQRARELHTLGRGHAHANIAAAAAAVAARVQIRHAHARRCCIAVSSHSFMARSSSWEWLRGVR